MTDDTKKTRTEYKRNWRHKNPEKVRKNKNTSYWNNPEKYRKKSRETWRKNQGSSEKGKVAEKTALIVNSSATTVFRLMFIKKYAREFFEEFGNKEPKKIKIYPIYIKVVKQRDSFAFDVVRLFDKKGQGNVTEQDLKDLAAKFEYLTFPFNLK